MITCQSVELLENGHFSRMKSGGKASTESSESLESLESLLDGSAPQLLKVDKASDKPS